MPLRVLSSRAFRKHIGRAKRAAANGPVLICDGGSPAYVLTRYEEYRRLAGGGPTLFDLIGQLEPDADFDFTPARWGDERHLAAKLD